MKKISGFFLVALMFSVVLGITSCGKDGDTGPAGAAGANGPKGDKGDKGDQGEPGAADVIYSEWLDVEYLPDTSAGVYFVDIDAPKVTADVLNTGFVKVYINLGTSASPLVVTVPYSEEGGFYIKDYLLEGVIELVSNGDPSTYVDGNGAKRAQVRYVIVPGGTAARSAKTTIDWNDYAKVKAYMGWKN